MRFASLGSGSEGNALLAEARDGSRLLIDCGFGIREAVRRLARLDVDPASLSAILVTHEHADHVGGVCRLADAHRIPVYLTRGTMLAARSMTDCQAVNLIDSHQPFDVAGFHVEPFPVPHDAREPVQFVLDDGDGRLGVLTDVGHSTAYLPQALSRLTSLILECNHDAQLLAISSYPESLKRRIGGRYGHLANTESAALLRMLDRSRLRRLVAAHLSRQNNRPELARAALAEVMGWSPAEVLVADQDDGLAWTAA